MDSTTPPALLDADFDQFNRYGAIGLLLRPLLAELARPCRVLEVGCNVLDFLEDLLEPYPVEVVRCDVEHVSEAKNFVLQGKDGLLPFGDDSFDFVVALEVLEHVPAGKRVAVLADWKRVARRGILLTCPVGGDEVEAAEALADRAFQSRNGRRHPWLVEHQEFGVPTNVEVGELLAGLGLEAQCWNNSPLLEWLPLLLLTEELNEAGAPELRRLFNRLYNARPRPVFTAAPAYRQVWCAFKDQRLAHRARTIWNSLPSTDAGQPIDPLAALSTRLRNVCGQLLETCVKDGSQQREARLVAHLERRLRELEVGLKQEQRENRRLRFAAKLRARRSKHPSFPSPDVETHQLLAAAMGPGTWECLGDDPYFCWPQPAASGWHRLVIEGESTSDLAGKLYFDDGHGFCETRCFLLGPWRGRRRIVRYFHLDHPASRWRYDPMEAPGFIALRSLEIQPTARWRCTLARALARLGARFRDVLQAIRPKPSTKDEARADYVDPLVHARRPLPTGAAPYHAWLADHEVTEAEAQRIMERLAADRQATFAVVVTTPPGEAPALARTLKCLARQSLRPQRIVVATPASSVHSVQAAASVVRSLQDVLEVRVAELPLNPASIAQDALECSRADYFIPLEAGDECAPHALLALADVVHRHPDAVLVYTDEGELDEQFVPRQARFKPAWSPDLFLARPYVGRIAAYQSKAAREVGGFQAHYRGECEYDLILRLAAMHPQGIHHLPLVLCHRPPRASQCGEQAIRARILRRLTEDERGGWRGEVQECDGRLRLRVPQSASVRVSIVIPTAGKEGVVGDGVEPLVLNCLRQLHARSTYRNVETIVVDNGQLTAELERRLTDYGVRRLTLLAPFNFAASLNQAARVATGEFLLFLNDDVEVITPDWLEAMLDHGLQPGVGAVGAKLYFPDGRLQHVGVLAPEAEPSHPYYGCPGDFPGGDDCALWPRNYLAVTGACLLTPRWLFLDVGGFDEAFSLNYNDVDYCLRLRERGYRSVFVPYAELYHHEAMARGGQSTVRPWELALFRQRWGSKLPRDPFDNLSPQRGTYRIP